MKNKKKTWEISGWIDQPPNITTDNSKVIEQLTKENGELKAELTRLKDGMIKLSPFRSDMTLEHQIKQLLTNKQE